MENRLVLVAAAGSATASSLELSALGANVGPGEEKVHHKHLYIIKRSNLKSKQSGKVSHYCFTTSAVTSDS